MKYVNKKRLYDARGFNQQAAIKFSRIHTLQTALENHFLGWPIISFDLRNQFQAAHMPLQMPFF